MRCRRTSRLVNPAQLVLTVAIVTLAGSGQSHAQPAPQCQPSGSIVPLPELTEASGLAVSRRSPGRLWSHNDAGDLLVALDTRGAVTARVRVTGVKVEDWEAVAVGPCPDGSCVYIADIGDNEARRKQITVHRVAEPASENTVAVADSVHATYPDGAHDAETLLVTPDGQIFIVTKGEMGAVGLYRFPKELKAGATHQLERVGGPRAAGKAAAEDRVTDGTVSPDGAWVLLRTRTVLTFHRATELFAGNWKEAARVNLSAVGERQGEGVAMGADGVVYLAGEGGGKKQPGTFARLTCAGPSSAGRG